MYLIDIIFKILDISISDNSKCNSTKPLECNSSVKTIADQDVLVNNALIIDNGNI